jgi:hypothetical protein
VYGYLGYNPTVVVSPAATSNTYAVTSNGGVCCNPVSGHVFGGPLATVKPDAVQFVTGTQQIAHQWTVKVPANGSVILMHFTVQRDYNASTAADTQAKALADLTDPHALDGMDTATRSKVVNFKVPPQ